MLVPDIPGLIAFKETSRRFAMISLNWRFPLLSNSENVAATTSFPKFWLFKSVIKLVIADT
jgi:hypothetical protein